MNVSKEQFEKFVAVHAATGRIAYKPYAVETLEFTVYTNPVGLQVAESVIGINHDGVSIDRHSIEDGFTLDTVPNTPETLPVALETFTHYRQPYGTHILEAVVWTPIVADRNSHSSTKHCAAKGLGEITGLCVKGGTTGRLLQHTSHRSDVGTKQTVWAVSRADLDRGYKTTVAG